MFLENSIEMAFMCGFIVFVRRQHEGVNVPLLLPLGSFSWGVELVTERTKKRKRAHLGCYERVLAMFLVIERISARLVRVDQAEL